MAKILFIITHTSHQNGTIGLARRLQNRGHHCIFGGPEIGVDADSLKLHATQQGFEYASLEMTAKIDLDLTNGEDKEEILDALYASFQTNLLEGTIAQQYISEHQPGLILLDISFPIYAIAFHAFGIPIIFLSTKFCTRYDPWIPPLESSLIPQKTFLNTILRKVEWYKALRRRGLSKTYLAFLTRLADKSQFPLQERLRKKNSVMLFGLDLPEIVLNIQELDFSRKYHSEQVIWGGPCFEPKRKEKALDIQSLLHNRKLVYCAWGTYQYPFATDIFELLIETFKYLPEYYLVLATGRNSFEVETSQLPDNILLLDYAPQLQLLQQATCHDYPCRHE